MDESNYLFVILTGFLGGRRLYGDSAGPGCHANARLEILPPLLIFPSRHLPCISQGKLLVPSTEFCVVYLVLWTAEGSLKVP